MEEHVPAQEAAPVLLDIKETDVRLYPRWTGVRASPAPPTVNARCQETLLSVPALLDSLDNRRRDVTLWTGVLLLLARTMESAPTQSQSTRVSSQRTAGRPRQACFPSPTSLPSYGEIACNVCHHNTLRHSNIRGSMSKVRLECVCRE